MVAGLAMPAANARGQEPQQLQGLLVPEPKPVDEAELAGRPRGTRVEVLTPMRAYVLALIRGRNPTGPLAESLDAKILAEEAARPGAADFARFREALFQTTKPSAGRTRFDYRGLSAAFRDPSAAFFDVLQRRMAVETAARQARALEVLSAVAKQLAQGEGGRGLEFTPDRLTIELERARRAEAAALRQYRDRLDALKVQLGLSPRAPVVADAARLAPVRELLTAIDRWQADPRRNLDDLPRLVNRHAPLEGGVLDFLDDRPRLASLAADPARLNSVYLAAEKVAIQNHGGHDPQWEIVLEVRRRIRQLVEAHSAYESTKRELVTLLRLKDDAFETLVSPPATSPNGQPAISINRRDLIALNAEVGACEGRLVSLWASFQTTRLALARVLRILPASDWAALEAGLSVPQKQP
jgi:hypothetical protein